jgi:hypothetical protein
MARVDQFLQIIDDPSLPALSDRHPHDEVLLGLLVHLATSDGVVHGDEFALLRHVRPGLDEGELLAWVSERSAEPFEPSTLALVLTTPEERWSGLRFAARMVCLDGDVADEERAELVRIAAELQLPDTAVQTVIDEVVATVVATPARVADALRHMLWDSLVPERDELDSDLASVVPQGAELVCRVVLKADDTEVAGLLQEGLVARFDDGPAFVRWVDIRAYTRVPVPGAAFHLHTAAGKHSVTDPRLGELGRLLDAVYPTS